MYVSLHHLPGLATGALALPALWIALRWRPLRTAWDARDPLTRLAAAALLLAGFIHLGLILGHAGSGGQQIMFAFNGIAFVACFVLALSVRWWRWPAGLLLLSTIAGYLVYIGSGKEEVDEVGMISKVIELLALGLALLPHQARRARRRLRWAGAATGLFFMTLLTGTVAYASEFRPESGHPHVGASGPPTAAQRAAADDLVRATAAGIARYQDPRVALADDYRPSGPSGPSSHWSNDRFQHDRRVLDPQRPETLVYANTKHGPVLLGAMYETEKVGQAGPQPGGTLTTWHTHDNVCITFLGGFQLAGFMSPYGGCPIFSASVHTQQMMHVWTAPNPRGPFGDLDEDWVKRMDQA